MDKTKSVIVCFGNCQAMQITRYLRKYLDLSKYEILLCSNYDEKVASDETVNIIANADIVIYQPLNDVYKDLSAKNMKRITKKESKLISFPYIYNDGVYSLEYNTLKFIGEDTIIGLLEKGYTKDTIIDMRNNGKIDFNLKEKFKKSLKIMKEKEKYTDIKLTKFIKKNYLDMQLFYSHQHPTNILFDELIRQLSVLSDLDIKLRDEVYIEPLCETLSPITECDKREHVYNWSPCRFHSTFGSTAIIELITYKYILINLDIQHSNFTKLLVKNKK